MNKEQRQKASRDQIERFFYSYYTQWRLAKILINDKVLRNKYDFLAEIAFEVKDDEINPNCEAIIAQELTNGLQFDMLANCLQYIEDLFALLKAGRQQDFFIKNIITYNAGQIENLIKQKHTDKELCEFFYFPYFENIESKNFREGFTAGMSQLRTNISKIKEFYKEHQFFYNQYKHGQTVALRPFRAYDADQIAQDKQGNMQRKLVAFDNIALNKVFNNKHRGAGYALMPWITRNIQPHITQLQAEDNLIRYVWSPSNSIAKGTVECAFIVRQCMQVFVNNLLTTIKEANPLCLRLPCDNQTVYEFAFPVVPSENTGKEGN